MSRRAARLSSFAARVVDVVLVSLIFTALT
jgi:hypothetical protein